VRTCLSLPPGITDHACMQKEKSVPEDGRAVVRITRARGREKKKAVSLVL
jgi:hypothetical protein